MLEYFIKEPEKEFYIRELAKLIKKSPTTTSKYLDEFGKKGILNSRRKFNHLLYKANNENAYFKNLKLLYNLNKLRSSGFIEYLVEEYNHPEAIVLFGSFAKAEDIPGSDIDILIVTPLKKEIALSAFETKLGRKVQLFIHSQADIERMKTKNKELLNNFINGIVLAGYLEIFK